MQGTNVWQTAGNIGVGTALPDEKLDVIGNVRLTGRVLFPNGVMAGTGSMNITATSGQLTLFSRDGAVHINSGTSADVTIQAGSSGGNVQITGGADDTGLREGCYMCVCIHALDVCGVTICAILSIT